MKKIPIIIDTDPGIDDAVAIGLALFSGVLDVKLITTVCGNVGIDKTTYNALRLMKFFGKNIPVAQGFSEPLIAPFVDASNVHGLSGMEGYDFEEPDKSLLCKEHAVEVLRTTILNSKEKITLVPIGTLTNIGVLIRMYPEVKKNIEKIVLMGGSLTRGNKGVMSEFNIATDPEAAKIVFNCGLDIVVAPLDVGFKALVLPEDSEKIGTMNKTGGMFKSLFQKYRGGSYKTGLKMYDSCAIAYLCKPEMFTTEKVFCDIEVNQGYTYGCSVVDLKNYLKKEPNVTMCMDINPEQFKEWFLETIQKCI